jgi:hypothetical protein
VPAELLSTGLELLLRPLLEAGPDDRKVLGDRARDRC